MAVINDGTGSSQVGVDNERAKVALYLADGTTEMAKIDGASAPAATQLWLPNAGRNDLTLRAMNVDRRGSLAVSSMVLGLSEQIEGTTQDLQSKWTASGSTMAAGQTVTGGILINSAAITTLNTNYALMSQRQFERKMRVPLFGRARSRLVGATNTTLELGFLTSTGATAQVNGMYWQVTPSGVVQPVVTFNSTDVVGSDIASSLNNANYYQWDVIVDDDSATFICQNTATNAIISEQTLQLPVTATKQISQTHLNYGARCFITTAAGSAPAIYLTEATVGWLDQAGAMNKPWNAIAGEFKPAVWSPTLPTTTAVNWANSAAPASATLSNTAAGYTTLGGNFQFVAVAGAATDYCLFGYTVPAPYTFVCTGITIDTWNTVVAVATTPHLFQWFVVPNNAAVSLASNLGRLSIGSQHMAIATPAGGPADRSVNVQFQTPLVTQPGRFFDIGLRMPVATATATQVIAGTIGVQGYFE